MALGIIIPNIMRRSAAVAGSSAPMKSTSTWDFAESADRNEGFVAKNSHSIKTWKYAMSTA
jgi:hypothetical protein